MRGIYESVGANIFFRQAKGLGNERTHGEFSQERSAKHAAEESRATSAHMAAPYVLSNGTRALHAGSSVPGDAYLTVNSSRLYLGSYCIAATRKYFPACISRWYMFPDRLTDNVSSPRGIANRNFISGIDTRREFTQLMKKGLASWNVHENRIKSHSRIYARYIGIKFPIT